MISSFAIRTVETAEAAAQRGDVSAIYDVLHEITLADFCELLLGVPAQYPALAKVVPRLPSEAEQKRWVGDAGRHLMDRSCNITRLFDALSWRVTGRSLREHTILDYGCGWGRLLRMMWWASHPRRVYGIDPLVESLDACRKCGITEQIELCEQVPSSLPYRGVQFSFAFSFSVFTHIPEHVAQSILSAVRDRLDRDGIFVVTVRSVDFWKVRRAAWGNERVDSLCRQHLCDGYAFVPLSLSGNDDGSLYGDTT
jgi:SAM-dependent methyltransferase